LPAEAEDAQLTVMGGSILLTAGGSFLMAIDSNAPNVEVYVVSALDVAISKLGRFGDRDQHDIQALLQLPHVGIGEFERLAREAISYYVGDELRILGNLNVVLDDYHRSEG
ncbi:DUF6036 family nucleotidyltransferase, partial [Halomonas campisalis]